MTNSTLARKVLVEIFEKNIEEEEEEKERRRWRRLIGFRGTARVCMQDTVSLMDYAAIVVVVVKKEAGVLSTCSRHAILSASVVATPSTSSIWCWPAAAATATTSFSE